MFRCGIRKYIGQGEGVDSVHWEGVLGVGVGRVLVGWWVERVLI